MNNTKPPQSSITRRLRRYLRIMEERLSLPLSLLKNVTTSNKTLLNTTAMMDDVSVTPSIRHAQDRAANEYAENIDSVDDSYKIVVGFLVPALLIVQWSVEWHNDEEWSLTHPSVTASLVSILCFMVLAPCFIQIMRNRKYLSLAPILCLSIADVCVIFRCDSAALVVMVMGNLFMGTLMVYQKKVLTMTTDREESLREGLLCVPVDSSEEVADGAV